MEAAMVPGRWNTKAAGAGSIGPSQTGREKRNKKSALSLASAGRIGVPTCTFGHPLVEPVSDRTRKAKPTKSTRPLFSKR